MFENFISILRKLYFLNGYTLLIKALSLLQNGTLQYQHIVIALKMITYNNIDHFCLQTSKMYLKLHMI